MKYAGIFLVALVGAAFAQDGEDDSPNGTSLADVISANSDSLSELESLLKNNTGVLEALNRANNITLLAPDNDALKELLDDEDFKSMASEDPDGLVEALLQYHVLNGTFSASDISSTPSFVPTMLNNPTYVNVTGGQVVEAVSKNGGVSFYSGSRTESKVVKKDISFSGGVIHVIDTVLEIPKSLTSTAINGNFTAAAGALTQTDLASGLDQMQNITVFVPNNKAFSDIGSILNDISTQSLSDILKYHVIAGTVAYSSTLTNGSVATALSGEDVNISITNDDVYVDSARVVVPNVLIANGVLHVIDRVLNPNSTAGATTPNVSATTPAFTGASSVTNGVPFTSGITAPTEEPTGVAGEETSTQGAPLMSAAVAMGALFGGAAMLVNGL